MKTIKTFVLLMVVIALVGGLYGLTKAGCYTRDFVGGRMVYLPRATVVEILRIGANNRCAVAWSGHVGVIPCDSMYFMGRWPQP